jgi:hypothetical protein
MMLRHLPLALLLLLPLPACKSALVIDSRPEGAGVVVDGRDYGQTPVRSAIRSSTFGTYYATLTRPGYEPVTIELPKETYVGRIIVDSLFFFPALFFNIRGPTPVVVDLKLVAEPAGVAPVAAPLPPPPPPPPPAAPPRPAAPSAPVAAPPGPQLFCIKCGRPLPAGAAFCEKCGTKQP